MRRILSLLLAVASLGIIVADLVTTTIAANARSRELREDLVRVPPPSGAVSKRGEAHAATRRAAATAVFEGKLATVDLLAHYQQALEATGWSTCGTRRSGYVYTGEVIQHHVYCKGPTQTATVSIEKATGDQTTQYALTFEWNTRWWWIPVFGLGLTLIAIIALQAAFRRQPVGKGRSITFRTELRLDECRQRLESLAGRSVDGLVLRRYEGFDSIIHFEMERHRRSRWNLNALAAYFYGTLRPEADGTRVEGRFGLSPAAKSVGAVVGILLLMGAALQARGTRAAILNAGIIIAAAVLAVLLAPRFWRADQSLVEQALERVLGARRVA